MCDEKWGYITGVSFYLKITPVFSCQRHFHEIYDVITAPIVSINKKYCVSWECKWHGFASFLLFCIRYQERYDAWQKSRICSLSQKELKILETRATACHFAMLFLVSRRRENDSAARLEYFQLEDGHREIGFDGYSEIVHVRRDVLEDHRCMENMLTLIHNTPVALNPTAAFFQNSKTVTLTRKAWKTLKRLLCIFSVRHYFAVFMSEKSFRGKVTLWKANCSVQLFILLAMSIKEKNVALRLKNGKYTTYQISCQKYYTIPIKNISR